MLTARYFPIVLPKRSYKSKQAGTSALLAGYWSCPCQRWMIWTG